jgi:hypothetical protein
MGIRRLALTVTGATVLALSGVVGGMVAAAPPALAAACSTAHNGYGWWLNDSLGGSPTLWHAGGASGVAFCDLGYGGACGWDYLQKQGTNECLTWNSTDNDVYDSTCRAHPAAQSWAFPFSFNLPEGFTEIENYYAQNTFPDTGGCITGSTRGDAVYLNGCLPNGSNSQDWAYPPE